jgi:predicted Zn-ribbon and HTH transcriptional regulator
MKKIKLKKTIFLEFEDHAISSSGVLIAKNQSNQNDFISLSELTAFQICRCAISKNSYLFFLETALPLVVCDGWQYDENKIYELAQKQIEQWGEDDLVNIIYPMSFLKKYQQGIIDKIKKESPGLSPFVFALLCPKPKAVIFPEFNNPKIRDMAKSLGSSVAKFIKSGMRKVSPEQFEERLQVCKTCDLWDSSGFGGTGRCKKCGCSTWAKLRMATERCPIGKWEAVQPPEPSEATRQAPSA